MTTEQKVKDIIAKKKKVHIQQIARELRISTGYAIFICQALQRRGQIDYSGGWANVKGFEEKRVAKKKKGASNEVTPKSAKKLKNSGYKTIEDVAEAPLAILMQKVKINLKKAAGIINGARKKLKRIR